jgi:hypothetical protein
MEVVVGAADQDLALQEERRKQQQGEEKVASRRPQ